MKRDRTSWFNPGYLYPQQSLEREILRCVRRNGITSLRERVTILDVGSGYGEWLKKFLQWGAEPSRLIGVDLSWDRLKTAKRKSPVTMKYLRSDATQLPFGNETFDIVFQGTMFTSILAEESKQKAAREMTRVLKGHGFIIWYDFSYNNPWNPNVRGVNKAEIRMLFSDCQVYFQRVTLAPFLGRFIAPYSRFAFEVLESLSFLNTHYLAVIKKVVR